MTDRRIYLLSPKQHSPETIAVAFAKTSRSPESFDEIAAHLSDDKSADFHEKWVVGYGHASVAEHAVLHIALENVSRLAVECIESNRLASYTEKSTRYQKWDSDNFHIPAELDGHPLREEFIKGCRLLFKTYLDSLGPVKEMVLRSAQRKPGETDEALDRRVRSQYVDVCRFLLPAASLANVGMTANARVLENAIRKMLSHQLQEVRDIGTQVKAVARAEVPTLVKYADAVPYMRTLPAAMESISVAPAQAFTSQQCKLVWSDPDAEVIVLAAALFRFGGGSHEQRLAEVRSLPADARAQLAQRVLASMGEHDVPLRELEYAAYTFELVMDQGAYAEFKRHRMMTQTAQELTTDLGYAVPRRMVEAGLEDQYRAAMEVATHLHSGLAAELPVVAQYVVPNGCYRRVLAHFNLREAFAFCELRAAPNAHFSIREIAMRIAEQIRHAHPVLSKYLRVPSGSAEAIAARHFQR